MPLWLNVLRKIAENWNDESKSPRGSKAGGAAQIILHALEGKSSQEIAALMG